MHTIQCTLKTYLRLHVEMNIYLLSVIVMRGATMHACTHMSQTKCVTTCLPWSKWFEGNVSINVHIYM